MILRLYPITLPSQPDSNDLGDRALPLVVVCVPSTSPVHFPLKDKRSQYTHGQREVILKTRVVEM
jgi:hypothetical protein